MNNQQKSKSKNRNNNSRDKAKREQPRKDSRAKRINDDNERKSKFEKAVMEAVTRGGASNDISWYAKNPEMLKSAASLPFSNYNGQPLPFDGVINQLTNTSTGAVTYSAKMNTVPGVMVMNWSPTIGGAFNDPINQAARSTYSFVVHANSRSKSYDAPDLMQVILCAADLFAEIAKGIRVYGVMRTYSQDNRYLPQALVEACGFDFNDLQSNLSHMWFDLNEIIARTQQIWIPNTFPFIERWFWMNSHIYMDQNSKKSQFYMFNSKQYLVYSETGDFADDNHLAEAKYKLGIFLSQGNQYFWPVTNDTHVRNFYKWSDYLTIINEMFTALLNSQDRGIIMGDILKAYGKENIYALAPITSDYQVVPVYDEEVLWQIENLATFDTNKWEAISQDPVTGDLFTSAYTPVTQDVQYAYKYNSAPAPEQQILNFHQLEDPTPEQIMIATRLKPMGCVGIPNNKNATLGYHGTKYGGLAPAACGTEVVNEIHLCLMGVEKDKMYPLWLDMNFTNDGKSGQMSSAQLSHFLIGSFDWHPFIYYIDWNAPWGSSISTALNYGTETQTSVMYACGDYDNYTSIDVDTIKKMHYSAIYSEFGVPTI